MGLVHSFHVYSCVKEENEQQTVATSTQIIVLILKLIYVEFSEGLKRRSLETLLAQFSFVNSGGAL